MVTDHAGGGPRWGLSPRVRGSRDCEVLPTCKPGSIPACAGEPPAWLLQTVNLSMGLSPRVRGSARHLPDVSEVTGLSPRVRGSLTVTSTEFPYWMAVYPRVCGGAIVEGLSCAARRSIPACAGEPAICSRPSESPDGSIPACAGEPRSCHDALNMRVRPQYQLGGLSPRVRGSRQSIAPTWLRQ